MAGHVAPEAARGGPIAALKEGDMIVFDIKSRRLDVELTDEAIQQRLVTMATAGASLFNRCVCEVCRIGFVCL